MSARALRRLSSDGQEYQRRAIAALITRVLLPFQEPEREIEGVRPPFVHVGLGGAVELDQRRI